MPDIVSVDHKQQGENKSNNSSGMVEIKKKYLGRVIPRPIAKAPLASGKSRAFMFYG